MKSTMASVCLGGKLMDRLRAIAEAGFQAVELFATDLEQFDGSPAQIKARIDDLGLTLASYFPLRDVEGCAEQSRSSAHDRAQRHLDTAVLLGAKMVMVCSNTDASSLPEQHRIAADLYALGDLAAQRNLNISYEALAWGRHVSDYRVANELIARVAHPRVGLVLDAFHILAKQLPVEPIRQIPSDRIKLVQLSDAPMLDLDYLSWSRQYRGLPGQGEFALAEFVQAVRATGYAGVVSLECFSESLRSSPPEVVAKQGFQALERLWADNAPSIV